MLTLLQDKMDTPLGPLWVLCDEQFNLRAVEWDEHRAIGWKPCSTFTIDRKVISVDCRNPGGLSSKLNDYFAGDLAIINTLPTPPLAPCSSVRSAGVTRYPLWPGDALWPTGRGARRPGAVAPWGPLMAPIR
ncbi:hypothetical protein LNO81_12825 [Klebsiella variicola subsp. variicola]|nr:hypothetical protein [Klebsiella variicola subsp. variicola]